MNVTQAPISLPAEHRLNMTAAAVALALAVASLGVVTMGQDESAPAPQQVRVVQPIGYGSGV